MNAAESGAVQMLFPFFWEPSAYRHALEIRAKVDTSLFSDTGYSLTVNISFTSFVRCQVNIMKRKCRFCDENVCAMQVKLRKQRHLQFAASCCVIEVSAVRSDQELGSKETRALTAESPCHIGTF